MYVIFRFIGLLTVAVSLIWIVLNCYALYSGENIDGFAGESLGRFEETFGMTESIVGTFMLGGGIGMLIVGFLFLGFASVIENTYRSRRILDKMLEIGSRE